MAEEDYGNFNFIMTGQKDLGMQMHTSYQIHTNDRSMITVQDIQIILDQFTLDNPNANFRIRGLGVTSLRDLTQQGEIRTLKSLNGVFNLLSEEEYLHGRLTEDTKYLEYFQIMIDLVEDYDPFD